MRVLIFTNKSNDNDMKQRFASLLVQNMDKYASVILHTSLHSFKEDLTNNQTHIVHIIGCKSINSYRALRIAINHSIPVVLSPMGDIMQWNHNTFRQTVLRPFVKDLIQQADAIHACSHLEALRMQTLAWNPRLETIQNGIISNQISTNQMASAIIRLYNKVIDSNTFRLLTDEEKQVENTLLRIGLALTGQETAPLQLSRGGEYQSTTQEASPRGGLEGASFQSGTLPPSLWEGPGVGFSPSSWRKILLHANDEHILHFVNAGAHYLQIQTADLDIEKVERFQQKHQKPDTLLPADQLSAKHAIRTRTLFEHLRQDEKPSETELALCYLLVNTQHALRQATLTKRQLAQLPLLLRFSHYDDDKAARMISRLRLTSFTESILQILAEIYGLPEGFMPIQPADNRYTNTIRKKLHNINLQ